MDFGDDRGPSHRRGLRSQRFAVCDFLLTRVEIHQKSLEPEITSTECHEVVSCRSRYERHMWNFDHFALFDALLVVLTANLLARSSKRMSFWLACMFERRDLVLIVFNIAVGQISVVLCSFSFANHFLEVFWLGLREIPEEYLKPVPWGRLEISSVVRDPRSLKYRTVFKTWLFA